MARIRSKVITVKGTLVAVTPLHVGGESGDAVADLVLVRNGLGKPVIPGTSLAGAFRSWARSTIDNKRLIERVFGYEESRSASGEASRLYVDDGIVTTTGTIVQMHTAIGRWTGAAYPTSLFSREILPRGSEISFSLELESSDTDEKALLGHLLTALSNAGAIDIGGAKTRGLGEVELAKYTITEEDWDNREGVLAALTEEPSEKAITAEDLAGRAELTLRPRTTIDITIGWEPLLPVMVSEPGGEIDITARTEIDGDRVHLSLPGSSIKGALRSRAEYIVRTLLGEPPASAGSPGRQWEQTDLPIVSSLFGTVVHHGDDNTEMSGNVGALSVSSIRSTTSMPQEKWEALADVTKDAVGNKEGADGTLRKLLGNLNTSLAEAGAQVDVATHVAIDRFTGGAADGALYVALEPHGFTWEPIRLRLDLERLGDDPLPSIALLMTTIGELCNGWVPLGFGTTRGYGAIRVTAVNINPSTIEHDGRSYSFGELDVDGQWATDEGLASAGLARLVEEPAK